MLSTEKILHNRPKGKHPLRVWAKLHTMISMILNYVHTCVNYAVSRAVLKDEKKYFHALNATA